MDTVSHLYFCLWLFLEVLTILLSTFLNSVVIYVMSKEQKLRRISNFYIISVAISDLLTGLTVIPLTIFRAYIIKKWTISVQTHFCTLLLAVVVMLLISTLLQLIAISIDRYLAICHPIYYRNRDRSVTIIMLSMCWIIGFFGGIRMIVLNYSKKECSMFFSDKEEDANGYNYVTYTAVICVITFVISYTFIYRALINQGRKREASNNVHILNQKEIRAAKTMMWVVFTFLLCWTPVTIFLWMKSMQLSPSDKWTSIIDTVCYSCIHWNFVLDPLIYAYRIKDVRKTIRNIFCVKIKHGVSNVESSINSI